MIGVDVLREDRPPQFTIWFYRAQQALQIRRSTAIPPPPARDCLQTSFQGGLPLLSPRGVHQSKQDVEKVMHLHSYPAQQTFETTNWPARPHPDTSILTMHQVSTSPRLCRLLISKDQQTIWEILRACTLRRHSYRRKLGRLPHPALQRRQLGVPANNHALHSCHTLTQVLPLVIEALRTAFVRNTHVRGGIQLEEGRHVM